MIDGDAGVEEEMPKKLMPVGLSLGAEEAIEVAMEEKRGALRLAEAVLVLFESCTDGGE